MDDRAVRSRVAGPSPEDWADELQRLIAAIGDDADALEAAGEAVAASAEERVTGLAPAVAVVVRHCEAADAAERERRFELAASALFYAHTSAEAKAWEREARASQEQIDELVEGVDIIDVTGDDSGGDDDVLACEPTASEAAALRLAAEQRREARALKRQSEEDAKFARALSEAERRASTEQEAADERLARELEGEADARVAADERLAKELARELGAGAPAAAGPAAAGPAAPAGDDVRHLRVVLPGGARIDLARARADQPLALVFEKLRPKLGLGPREDPLADFALAAGTRRFSREDVRSLSIGDACGADRRLRLRVERRDQLGVVLRGAGGVFRDCELMRLSVNGTWSPILVIRDVFQDGGERIAALVERHSVAGPLLAAQPRSYQAVGRRAGAPKSLRAYAKAAGSHLDKVSAAKPAPAPPRRTGPAHLDAVADSVRRRVGLGRGRALTQQSIPIAAIGGGNPFGGFGTPSNVPSGLALAADECLDMAERAVADPSILPRNGEDASEASRRFAARALANRRAWKIAMGIMYPPRGSLFNHVDGMGHWVCLFSLGNESTFHCGSTTSDLASHHFALKGDPRFDFTFKSGDVLIFNGDPAHKALHGMARVHPDTNPADAPSWLQNTRTSVQVRQL